MSSQSLLLVARYICVGSLLVARYALLVHRETEYINRLRGRTYVHRKLYCLIKQILLIQVVDKRLSYCIKILINQHIQSL